MSLLPKNDSVFTPVADRNWQWLLALGILFVFLGIAGLSMVVGLTLVSILFLGVLFVVAGVGQIIDTFKSRQWRGALLHVLIAILYIFAGSLVIYDPILASEVLTALLAWTLILMGLIRCFMAAALNYSRAWGWLFFSGVVTFILGVMILAQWPVSALWVFGLFIAIELLVNGWSYIFIALSLYKLESKRILPL